MNVSVIYSISLQTLECEIERRINLDEMLAVLVPVKGKIRSASSASSFLVLNEVPQRRNEVAQYCYSAKLPRLFLNPFLNGRVLKLE